MSLLNAIIQLSDYVRGANKKKSFADTELITSDFINKHTHYHRPVIDLISKKRRVNRLHAVACLLIVMTQP